MGSTGRRVVVVLLIGWAASAWSGCGRCGDGAASDLPELGEHLHGKVFAFAYSHPSADPLQNLDEGAKKAAIYFEATTEGLRYLKVVMDLYHLSYVAYAGKVRFDDDDRLTFEDTHLCHGREWMTEEHRGTSIDVMLHSMSGCFAPEVAPATYTVKRYTERGKQILYDPSGALTLVELYREVPATVDARLRPLLGVYTLMMRAGGCFEHTPRTNLSIYASPDGQVRYTWLQEYGQPFDGYLVDEGTVSMGEGTLTLASQFNGLCPSKFFAYPTDAPVFPPNIRTVDGLCQTRPPSPATTFAHQVGQTRCSSMLYDQLLLQSSMGSFGYQKNGIGPRGFPATSGTGSHYIWSVVPPAPGG